jgi:hypothetical protein
MVGTSALNHPDLKVEIEADAIIGSAGSEDSQQYVSLDAKTS